MSKDKFKQQFAASTAEAFKRVYPEVYKTIGDEQVFAPDFVFDNLETPKDPKLGWFSLPVFRFVRLLKDKPPEIAAKVAAETNALVDTAVDLTLARSSAVAGFLNAQADHSVLTPQTLGEVLTRGSRYGDSDEGQSRNYLVEYCSANIAKPMGIGHLRSTVIGNSLRRIYRKLGYNVVGINYLGDWGTQFGKMIVAYRRWGEGTPLDGNAVKPLLDLYVRFHDAAEEDDSLNEEARQAFRKLEEGDPEITGLWEKFKAISMTEFERIHKMLGVEFDWITGEAFLNDKMEPVIERLQKDGLTEISNGALVVILDDPRLPPCLLKKADGGTLYATRELSSLIYRWDKYRFHESLYVVGSAQADHFKQVQRVVAMMEEAEGLAEADRMTGRVKHVEFGWVKFGDKTMSTRRGNIIFLEDVIERAVTLAREKIIEKNPELKAIDETARMIGVGAVIFGQLSVKRHKDVNFIWEDVLNFEGETGPYLQYTHARLCSLERNYSGSISPEINPALLDHAEERRVVELLADFPDAVADAARAYDPQAVAVYLLRLGGAFNKVYQRKDDAGRIDRIISDDTERSAARMALVKAVRTVIREGLLLLGLEAPEEM
ncbi:MAG: arginine--tRNA ligase [candidate division Zixibacteria bacterium]|nr:arginine--tRNA ligase [candidate division Zixibacteria bacterium]